MKNCFEDLLDNVNKLNCKVIFLNIVIIKVEDVYKMVIWEF